jgi:hypothetical protein
MKRFKLSDAVKDQPKLDRSDDPTTGSRAIRGVSQKKSDKKRNRDHDQPQVPTTEERLVKVGRGHQTAGRQGGS